MGITRTHSKHTMEKYNTCKVNKNNLQMKDTNTDTHNSILRALQEMNNS
jgi:hypothetical protein